MILYRVDTVKDNSMKKLYEKACLVNGVLADDVYNQYISGWITAREFRNSLEMIIRKR